MMDASQSSAHHHQNEDTDHLMNDYVISTENQLYDHIPVQQASSVANIIQEEAGPMGKRFDFPDPGKGWFLRRFFVGMAYPFRAVVLCFSEKFILISMLEGLLIALVVYFTVALGCTCGYFTANACWNKPSDRRWHLLWKFIPYNLFGLWVILVITWCLFYVGLFFLLLFVPFRAAVDSSCKRLSLLVERRMKGMEINLYIALWGEESSANGEPAPTCCTPEWFIKWVKSYALAIVHGYFKQFKKIFVQMVKKYLSRFIQFVITNTLTFMLGFLIPGVGFFVSIVMFILKVFTEAAMLGLDVIMDRKDLGFFECERTVWNNFSVIAGLGFGLILVAIIPGGILLLYPVTIISTTRLFIHLDNHERTGNWDEFWNLPLGMCMSFHPQNSCFIQIISRRHRKTKSVKRRMKENQISQQPTPVEIETTIDHMDDYTL